MDRFGPKWTPLRAIGPQFFPAHTLCCERSLPGDERWLELRPDCECWERNGEWSQARLAAEVGVTRQTINSIEKLRYNPNLRLAFKIARAFGKLIEEVFIYEPERRV